MAKLCSCIFKECPILSYCKRGLNIFQGEPIDFKFICNMDNKYEYISLVEIENSITEGEDNEKA